MGTLPWGPCRARRGSTGSGFGFGGPWEPWGGGTGPCVTPAQQLVPPPMCTGELPCLCRGEPGLSCSLRAAHCPGRECQVPQRCQEGSVGICGSLCVPGVPRGGWKGCPWKQGLLCWGLPVNGPALLAQDTRTPVLEQVLPGLRAAPQCARSCAHPVPELGAGNALLPLCSPAPASPAQPFVFTGSSALFIFPKCHLPSPLHATPPKK